MWDLLIVGTGPAGVSAALTARARGLSFLWFGSRRLSDKVEKAERILNYPGLPRVTGRELRDAFLRQVDDLGIPIQQARVAAVYEMGGHYAVCAGPDFYEGRCLILATCDGELYRGRNIAVVCESQSLEEDVRFLQSVAGHVELFCTYAGGLADTPGCHKGRPQAIEGDDRVTGVRWADATLPVEGVFCLRETVAPQALLSGLAMENGHIQVDRAQRTNLPGCFAAGDCTGRPYQYAKAAGEGNVAVHSALAFLAQPQEEPR